MKADERKTKKRYSVLQYSSSLPKVYWKKKRDTFSPTLKTSYIGVWTLTRERYWKGEWENLYMFVHWFSITKSICMFVLALKNKILLIMVREISPFKKHGTKGWISSGLPTPQLQVQTPMNMHPKMLHSSDEDGLKIMLWLHRFPNFCKGWNWNTSFTFTRNNFELFLAENTKVRKYSPSDWGWLVVIREWRFLDSPSIGP